MMILSPLSGLTAKLLVEPSAQRFGSLIGSSRPLVSDAVDQEELGDVAAATDGPEYWYRCRGPKRGDAAAVATGTAPVADLAFWRMFGSEAVAVVPAASQRKNTASAAAAVAAGSMPRLLGWMVP
jgi:hypothetical protein